MPTIREVLEQNLTRPHQLNAALDENNEILALACAGSGKSRTLAFRIARLLASGADPKSIVAFTFTEKAAESIKLRVVTALRAASLPDTSLGAMYIGTIHSYCQSALGQMDARYRQFDVLDENRLKLYLISRYGELGLHRLSARGRYFEIIRKVSDAWKTMNDELVAVGDVSQADAVLGGILAALGNNLDRDQ